MHQPTNNLCSHSIERTINIPLSSLRKLKDTHYIRDHIDKSRVILFADLYKENGSPILGEIDVVAYQDVFIVADGVHRMLAAEKAKLTELPARVISGSEGAPQLIAYVHSVETSTATAKPLSMKERRRAADHLMRIYPNWSNRKVAKVVGVSEGSIRRWKKGDIKTTPKSKNVNSTDKKLVGGLNRAYDGLLTLTELRFDFISNFADWLVQDYGDKALPIAQQWSEMFTNLAEEMER